MLLGKCPRPQKRRSTSMAGVTFDLADPEAPEPSDHGQHSSMATRHVTAPEESLMSINSAVGYDQPFSAVVSLRDRGMHNAGFSDASDFLTACSLCKRSLASGRDIYMYRGDAAFCSIDCREQQMKNDENKAKYGVVSENKDHRA